MAVRPITGHRKLDRKLRLLGEKHAPKAARKAVSRGINVITREIRKSVPKAKTEGHTGKPIKQSVGQRVGRRRKRDEFSMKSGIGVGKKRKEGQREGGAPHAHLFALGTRRRKNAKQANRGLMPANEFVIQARKRAKAPAMAKTMAILALEIQKAAALT